MEAFLIFLVGFVLLAGVAAIAFVFHTHLSAVTDNFLDHLTLREQETREMIEAEVAKRFNT
jgi:hypothetical protein